MPKEINRTTTVYCHCDIFTVILFSFYFPCYSLKLECEKLASEKIEIQRHYVMVSMSLSCVLKELSLGRFMQACNMWHCPDVYQKCANVVAKLFNWMSVLSFICDLTLKIYIIREWGGGGVVGELKWISGSRTSIHIVLVPWAYQIVSIIMNIISYHIALFT